MATIVIKSLDSLIQLIILGVLAYFLLNSQYSVSAREFEDYSLIYFLGIGIYQVLSYVVHLFTFRRVERLSLGRNIYVILASLFFLGYYIYAQLPYHYDYDNVFLAYLHFVALYYLAISISETLNIFLLPKKKDLA